MLAQDNLGNGTKFKDLRKVGARHGDDPEDVIWGREVGEVQKFETHVHNGRSTNTVL